MAVAEAVAAAVGQAAAAAAAERADLLEDILGHNMDGVEVGTLAFFDRQE